MSQARILAVDDQLYFRVFLEDLLKESGFEVEAAASAPAALERLEAERFDVVLTDLVMPGMDGSELVQRVKERWPEQEIVVITSVGDVKTAVDAMKLGATDYLLKPLDKTSLIRSVETILERMRIQSEHRQLVAENLEYLSVFTQYERVLGLLSTQSLEALADRIVEIFCLEANAHGGVIWLRRPEDAERLRLAGVGGLVRVEDEESEFTLDDLPDEIAALGDAAQGSLLTSDKEGSAGTTLYVPLRVEGPLLGILRVTDKLDGSDFDAADVETADRLGPYAGQAVANALSYGSLERRSFRDTNTHAYTRAYFEDVVDNEIQKALRFGRTFSLVRIEVDQLSELRQSISRVDLARLLQEFAGDLAGALRSTDLLAVEADGRFCALLPESSTIGALVAKRRLRAALERNESFRGLNSDDRPAILASTANFPSNGQSLDALREILVQGVEEDRASMIRAFELESAPFRGLVDAFLADAPMGRPETAEQMTRFVLSEVRRRPEERGILFVSPGVSLEGALRDGLAELRDTHLQTEIVLVADPLDELPTTVPVTWIPPERAGTECPFLVYYGDGPPYAMVREPGADKTTALYHTADPIVVEHLAFQLGRDLGIPIGE